MSDKALSAYDSRIKTTETGAETDAAVLEKSAFMLELVKKDPQSEDFSNALRFNQLIWTTIQTEMAENTVLPAEIRANLISLAIFTDKQSLKALAERKPALLDSLININRNIAVGLRQTDDAQPPQQTPPPATDIST